jgi:uncharacterized membrane protein
MIRFIKIWSDLRSNFWFIPSLIVLAGIAFAAALIELDSAGSAIWMASWSHLFGTGAEGARWLMSMVGVTFSMILVVLALASSQYFSRILRNFMRSRVKQAVLGIFAGIFSYSEMLEVEPALFPVEE